MSKEKIKVNCTWGDGPDVLVTLDKKNCLLLEEPRDLDRLNFGRVKKAQFDLTAKEALALSFKLYFAAKTAMELEKIFPE